MLRRHEIQDDLVRVPGCDARHRRAERGHRDADTGDRTAQAKAMCPHVPAVVVRAFAGQDPAQAVDGLAHARRGVGPFAVVPPGHDRRAGRPQCDAEVSAGERGDRRERECDGHRASHADRDRADLQAHALRAMADGRCQRERVEGRQLADPERAEPGALHLEGDVDRLLVRPVEPERKHGVDPSAHSTAVSASWPSRIRPGSSRDAALTWKWAVAVWASRNRR